MNGYRHLPTGRAATLAGIVMLALTAHGQAQNLIVRNESSVPVVVQTAGVVRGSLRRDRPVLLDAREISPPIVLSQNTLLSIYDAKAPNRLLYQGVIPASPLDQFYGIVRAINPAKMKIESRPAFPKR